MASAAGKLPFWIHQLVEYTVALLIASEGARSGKPLVPLIGAGAVLVLGATADGPVAAFRWVPRKVHRVLDLVVAAGLVLAGLVFRSAAGSIGQTVLIGGGALLLALALRTNYEPKPIRPAMRIRPARPTPPTASTGVASSPAPAAPESEPATLAMVTDLLKRPSTPTVTPASKPVKRLSRGARAEQVGRVAGRAVGKGVRSYRDRGRHR